MFKDRILEVILFALEFWCRDRRSMATPRAAHVAVDWTPGHYGLVPHHAEGWGYKPKYLAGSVEPGISLNDYVMPVFACNQQCKVDIHSFHEELHHCKDFIN